MQATAESGGRLFQDRLDDILDRTRYFRVERDDDREMIYRLRYEAYRREDAIVARDDLRFCDSYDGDGNALLFGVVVDGELAGSIRLHVLSPDRPTSPAAHTYPDIVGAILDGGESAIDPSRFITNPRARGGARLLPFAVTRLACMAAEHFGADWMFATVRLEHAAFYRRFCSLKPLTGPRPYPSLTKPLMLLGERNRSIAAPVFTRYPVFSSTPAERRALFPHLVVATLVPAPMGAPALNDNRPARRGVVPAS